ncbi:MAG: Gfo/Idh/MocA family oxidoreductase [Candidatus Latescibacteria bacterium]|jgi:predicted dehydrogenase|nr:Gfo/Idh/MocA family oxidoreductase [Candidatus Latescibacterota bacterium]
MPRPTYKAAIIGLGYIGGADQVSGDALGQMVADLDGTHLDALTGHPRVTLAAGSSRDAGRRSRFQARTGAPAYTDWREMLAKEGPDIVSVATYTPVHAEMTIACAEAGVRVIFCEKPIATRIPDAEAMVAACEAAGALLVVNHVRRFNPILRRLRALVLDDGLGNLTSASLAWGAGRLGNVGTHMIDTVRMLTGREVEAVSGTLDLSGRPDCRGQEFRDPGGWGMMRLERGLIVTVDAADHGTVPAQIAINGTRGRATTNRDEVTIEYADGRHEHWPRPEGAPSSMDVAVGEIVDWLDGGGPFSCAATESVRTLEAIVAFHASHRRNAAWSDLPLAGDDREIEVLSG